MCILNPEFLKTIKGARVIPVNDEGQILWHIREDKFTPDMDKMKVIMAFENGFKILEKQFYPIQFKSTSDISKAPIVMGFYNNGDSDLPQKFDETTLAYCYGNYGTNFKYSSDMFFNDKYLWADMNKPNIFNLAKVFVHECLHGLGFEHSDIKTDILFWQYQPNDEINFSQDTIDAIKKYYADEMAKVPNVPIESNCKNDVKDFCKNVIDFNKNKLYLSEAIFVRVLKYFGIEADIKDKKELNVKKLIDYLNV